MNIFARTHLMTASRKLLASVALAATALFTGVAFGQSADLTVNAAGPSSGTGGQLITYDITLSNQGPSPANSATYNIALGTNFVLQTATCTSNTGGASCPIISMNQIQSPTVAGSVNVFPAGGQVVISVTGRMPSSGPSSISTVATISVPGGVTELDASTNSSTVNTAMTYSPFDVGVAKTVSPAAHALNVPVTHTVTYTNNGPGDVYGILVSNTDYSLESTATATPTSGVSSSLSVGAASCVVNGTGMCPQQQVLAVTYGTGGANVWSRTLPYLAAGSSITYTYTVTLTALSGGCNISSYYMYYHAGNSSSIGDTNSANNVSIQNTTSTPYTGTGACPVNADVGVTTRQTNTNMAPVPGVSTNVYTMVHTNYGVGPANGAMIAEGMYAYFAGPNGAGAFTGKIDITARSVLKCVATGGAVCPSLPGVSVKTLSAGGGGNYVLDYDQYNIAVPTWPQGGELIVTNEFEVTVKACGDAAGQVQITNRAFSQNGGDPVVANNETSVLTRLDVIPTQKCADLTVSKAVNSGTVASGAPVVYTVDVSSAVGPAGTVQYGTATNIGFTDVLPVGFVYTSVACVVITPPATCGTPVYTAATHKVTDTIPSITNAGALRYTITGTASTLPINFGTHTNVATVAEQGPSFYDVSTNTNKSNVNFFIPTASNPTLNKTFSPTAIQSGTYSNLTFSLNNPAGEAARTMSFIDTLPSGLRVYDTTVAGSCSNATAATAVTTNGQTITVTNANVPAGAASCTIIVRVTNNPTAGSNSSCVGNPSAFTNSNSNISGLMSSAAGDTVNAIGNQCLIVNDSIKLTKAFSPTTVSAGGVTRLTFTLTNPSGNAALTTAFTDTLPSGLRYASQPNIIQTCANTPYSGITVNGASTAMTVASMPVKVGLEVCTISIDVTNEIGTQSSVCPNTATTNGAANITGTSNINNQVTDQCVTIEDKVSFTKAFSAAEIISGQSTQLTFTISNPPSNASTTISFIDTLPSGLKLADSAVTGTCTNAAVATTLTGGNTITVSGASVPAGAVTANGICTIIVNVTNVPSAGSNNSCISNPAAFTNGQGRISGVSANANSGVTNQCLVIRAQPATLTKNFSASSINPGTNALLTFTLTNPVNNVGQTANFVDTLPVGLVYANPAVVGGTCANATTAGVVTLNAGFTAATIAGVQIPSSGATASSCTVTVAVTNAAGVTNAVCPSGAQTNGPSNLSSVTSGNASVAVINGVTNQCLSVLLPAVMTKSYSVNSIMSTQNSVLTFTLSNPATASAKTALSFTDTLPAGLIIATPNGLPALGQAGNNCGVSPTALAGANTITLTGGTLAAGGASTPTVCTISVNVTNVQAPSAMLNATCASNPAAFTNTNTNITGLPVNGTLTNGITAQCLVVTPLLATLTKSFVTSPVSAPTTIVAGGTANLVFTVTNPINNPAQTGISFTDTLPAGLVVGTGSINNSCSPAGTVTATAGSTTVNASAIGVSAGTATPTICVISVPVTTAAGVTTAACPAATNTTNGASNVATTGISNGVTNQCLTVVAAPTLAKSFTPAGPVAAGTPVVMTFTLGNPASNPAMTDAGFTDTLPTGMVFSPAAPTFGGTCASTSGAALVRSVTGTTLTVSGVDIAASGASATTCTVTVTSVVIGAANQSLTNTTSVPTATVGGITVTGVVATAPLATTAANAPTISKAFGAASIQAGGTTTLTITLSNDNLVPAVLSTALVDTFPTAPGSMTLLNTTYTGSTCTLASISGSAGGTNITYNAGASIPAATVLGTPGTCTIVVNVTAPVAGTYVNTIAAGALTSNVGTNAAPANATLVVNNAPTIAKSFNPTTIAAGGTSKLTIVLTNNNPTVATLTSNLDDVLPAAPAGFTFTSVDASSTCTGTKSLPNTTTVRYASGATIPAASGGVAGSCTIVVNTTGTTTGTTTNTIAAGDLKTDKGNNANPTTATLTVSNAPTVAKVFSPATMKAGDISQLTITLTNNNPTAAVLSTSLTDTLPTGVTLANTNFGGSCTTASVSGSTGSNTITYAQGASIPGGAPGMCTITANVTATTSLSVTNNIAAGSLQTSNGNQAAAATAPLTVLVPPTVTKGFATNPIAPGAGSLMNLVLTNPNAVGTPSLTGLTMSDTLPPGMSILPVPAPTTTCGVPLSIIGNVVSVTGVTLAPAASCFILVNVTIIASNTTLNNTTAAPTATGPLALTGLAATAPLTTSTATPPTVAKAFNPVNIPVGGTGQLAIILTNTNLVPAVLTAPLEDMLPSGMTLANTVFGGSCLVAPPLNGNTNTVSGAAGDSSVFYTTGSYIPSSATNLGSGNGVCTIIVNVKGNTAGTKINVIDPGKLQTTMGNNNTLATATMSVVAPLVTTKTISPSPINIGAPSTMTITLANPAGNVDLTAAGIIDTLPGVAPNDMTFVNNTVGGSCTGTTKSISGSTLTFAGGSIPAGSSCTLTATVTIKVGSTTLTNTTQAPTATGGTGAGIVVTGNTAAADLTTNAAVAPTIVKQFSASSAATILSGSTSVLSFTITNNNAVPATLSAALTDVLPVGVSVASPVGFTTSAGCSAAGTGPAAAAAGSVTVLPVNAVIAAGSPGTCVVSFNVTSTTGGTVTNTIAAGDLKTNNGNNAALTSATLTVLVAPTVAKTFSPTSIPVGGRSLVTIKLTNTNAVDAALTSDLMDVFPANVVLDATPQVQTNCTNGLTSSTATSITLLAGAKVPANGVCVMTAYVTSAVPTAVGVPYTNTIPACSGSPSANGSTCLQTNAGNQTVAQSATLAVTSPLLTLTKSTPVPALAVGATSTYTLTVTNSGTGAATVAAIKEAIPANMQYVAYAGTGWTCPAGPITGAATIDCTYAGNLAASGGTAALTVDMIPLSAAAIPATGVTNKASVGTTGGTSVPVNPTTCTAAAVGTSNTALPATAAGAGCATNTSLVQAIDVIKSVNTAATKSGALSFDVPYKVVVKSTGSAAASNFQAVENLATTFATGTPTLAWVAGAAPAVSATSGATAGQCALNAAFVAAPSATTMFSGQQSLPAGGACEVTFTVRVTYASAAVIPATAQNNSVVATTYTSAPASAGGTGTGALATDTSTTGTSTPATPNGDTPLVTPVLLPLNPVLSLAKGAPTPALAVGVESTYPLTVSNTGNLVASAATVQEAIPANVQYTGFAGTGWTCTPAAPVTGAATVTCTFTGAGAAGIAAISGTSVLSIKVKPLPAAAGTGVINKASVDPTGGTNPPVASTCNAPNIPFAGCSNSTFDQIQTIDVVKSLNTAVTVINGNTFDVPYKVIVKNVGATVAATNFQAVENLATTFATGTPTLAWTSVALQPTVTAIAPATAAQCLLNPAFVAAPSATNMFDGRQTLPAGGACSVTFTVRVTYANAAAVPTATTQDNSVTATTYTTAPAAAGGTGTGVVVSDVSTNSATSPTTAGTDTASVTPVSLVILPADLSIQKNGPAMMTNGGALVYTLTVRNAGPGVANGATYMDTLPAGLTAVTASCGALTAGASCAVPTVTGVASVSGSVPTLPAGGSVTITINATAPASGSAALVNNSSVTSPAGIPDPNPTNNTSSVTTNIVAVLPKQADVSIVKTGATTVAPSGAMSYLLTVTNAGPGAANGSTVADAVPATVTGVAATCVSATGGASCTAPTVTGNNVAAIIATLPANATVIYQITGTAPATGTVANTATVKVPAGITDPNPANNSSTATTTIGAITGNANVAVVKTGDTSVAAGGTVTYKITVSNAGPDAANGTMLNDIVPAELSNVAASCGAVTGGALCAAPSVAGNTVSATIATLPANSTVTYTITAKAPVTPARFSNSATVTLPPGIADPNPSDNVGGPVITQITGGAAVSGSVYKDANRNNVKDAGELPIAGVIVTLRNAAGVVVGTTTTDASGNYVFTNVPAGTGYSIGFNYGTNPQGVATPSGTANDPLSGNANGLQSITGITVLNDNVTLNQNARLVDPSGVVYDSITRKPVAGATVCLLANGTLVTNAQLSSATPNCQVTDATGAYTFFINASAPTGAYSLQVTQPAGYLPPNAVQGGVSLPNPAGYNVPAAPGVSAIQPQLTAPTGSASTTYYFLFNNFGPAAQDVIQNHIPLDPIANAKLLVIKTAGKATAEVGDSVTYTVVVKRTDTAAGALPSFVVVDTLPVGFTYIPGTATVNGVTVTDASIGLAAQGTKPVMNMMFATPLSAGQQMTLTYRVRVGVGAAEGSGINRASAKYNAGVDCAVEPNKCSNEARATVKVTAGVFTPQACVIGKVFADCNKNGIQDNEEIGIPGVKLYMLDGTSIITDVEGKYSICDLKPQTGVLAVDRSTMPRGSLFGTTSNRNALDGSSLFIDLKKGELHRADFSEASCSNGVMEQIKSRRAQGEVRAAETEKSRSAAQPALNYQAKPVADPIQTTDGANQPAINVRQNNRQ